MPFEYIEIERVEKLSSEARQRTEISEKVQKKYNESLTTYNSLNNCFLNSLSLISSL